MAHIEYEKEHEVRRDNRNGATLCFQWGRYVYDGEDRHNQHGCRLVWRRPDCTMQAARGQARLPSIQDALEMIDGARKAGWGIQQGDR